MTNNLFKKASVPDLSNPTMQLTFLEDAHSDTELIQKEIEVNEIEQQLLKKRIDMMKVFVNDLPSSDPQYSMLLTQIRMDDLELIELRLRETNLVERFRYLK